MFNAMENIPRFLCITTLVTSQSHIIQTIIELQYRSRSKVVIHCAVNGHRMVQKDLNVCDVDTMRLGLKSYFYL